MAKLVLKQSIKAHGPLVFMLCPYCRLCRERLAQVEAKLQEVKAGRAPEYLNPLAQLQENMRIRTQVAG